MKAVTTSGQSQYNYTAIGQALAGSKTKFNYTRAEARKILQGVPTTGQHQNSAEKWKMISSVPTIGQLQV